jgi:hypothetical protein
MLIILNYLFRDGFAFLANIPTGRADIAAQILR